jgi:hypothetical protein
MDDINNLNILKKYIEYLVDLTGSTFSKPIITDNDYQSLLIESELFCKRVSGSNFITPGLQTKLLSNRLAKINEEFSFRGTLRALNIWKTKRESYFDSGLETKRRENILKYKEQMNNLLLLIDAKS